MTREQIVALLVGERGRLNRAIEALQGTVKRRGRAPRATQAPPKASTDQSSTTARSRRRGELSAAGRKAIADAARKRWAAIKAGKAPSPFAKSKKKKTA